MYKVSDFFDEIKRKTLSFFENHLFCIFFLFFILIIGTIGIWVKPIIMEPKITVDGFVNSFHSLNLIGFSAPLLVVLTFDKSVSLINNRSLDKDITIWFIVLYIISIFIIFILFAVDFSSDTFTWCSFIAWLLVLYLWILGNVDNPSYQKKTENKAASGGDNVNRKVLEE
ncbi:hypothetical protein C0W93_14535 [Photobacterium leiognathi subsp. mandapamensis]|uniref:Uncharacterized protein n=1 Tax=Photobacterium leiognathi subsp. mandapamensis TaxID=48408 RepID=A0A2T3KT20_PHOLD|nr:hypothetical protein [Photobacterium leiognathi]PSV09623.1 hypothetical protein C0W93_14535 [Photobacterium leiognathi subsp. mandapamensis]